MKSETNCPICSKNIWQVLDSKTYKETDSYCNSKNYKFIKHVFFNIWHNHNSEVLLKRCVCKNCGFILDFPRPEDTDLQNKYEYLSNKEKDIGATKNISDKVMRQEYKQSLKILKTFKSNYMKKEKKFDILDYGGGDGHMLTPMMRQGHDCYLVDYNKNPVPGIIHLGNTFEDIPKNQKFDLIICRHVIEHVSSPKLLIEKFKDFLKKDGLIYAIVPVEIWNSTKPAKDPVTHINYFQKYSFQILFENAGFETIMLKEKIGSYHGNYKIVAQILSKINDEKPEILTFVKSFKTTMSYIDPTFFDRLKNYKFLLLGIFKKIIV